MARFRVYVATSLVGSKVHRDVEVPDEDIEGLTDDEIWNNELEYVARELTEEWFERIA